MSQLQDRFRVPLKAIRLSLIAISFGLFFINIYGLIFPVDLVKGIPMDRGLPGYNYPVLPVGVLEEHVGKKTGSSTFKYVERINQLIYNSIFHYKENRNYEFFENWFLWTLGKVIYKHFGGIQNSDYIINGRGAWCGQVSEVLMTILKQSSIDSRFLGLSGHVVLEVKLDGKWIVADPDYGVVYSVGRKDLENPDYSYLILEPLRNIGYSERTISTYLQIFQSRENNVTLPVGSKLSPRLHIVEVAGSWVKWVFPLVLLIMEYWTSVTCSVNSLVKIIVLSKRN